MYGTTRPQTLVEVPTSIISSTGKTKLQAALERARETGQPAVGQWMEFPGFSLARTVAALGSDVSKFHSYILLILLHNFQPLSCSNSIATSGFW